MAVPFPGSVGVGEDVPDGEVGDGEGEALGDGVGVVEGVVIKVWIRSE
jgi:hypothetical protein